MAKLSAAQEKALNEINELGYTTARSNTRDSIAKYVTAKGPTPEDGLKLNAEGREVMGLGEETPEEVSVPEETSETPFADGVERFQNDWTPQQKVDAGFGATLLFRNTGEWDGLTAQEIKEDIKTAIPIGRAGQRRMRKATRNAAKELLKAM